MGRTRQFVIAPDSDLSRAANLSAALQARQGGAFVWLDFADPGVQTLTPLVKALGLHELAIEDCLDQDQVPKMEEFGGHTFILFNRYHCASDVVTIEEVNFFLGSDFLITVHSHGEADPAFGERLEATVRRDLEQAKRGPAFLLQVILDDLVDEKFAAVEALQDQLDSAEEELLQSVAEFRPARLLRLRRTLLTLRKSLVYEREILVKICRRDSPFIGEAAIYDFRDIYDHLAKFFEVVEICRELIASLMEIHLSMVNNRMTMMAYETNQVMRRLTMVMAVFMPLTLLAGVGGMSEWSMMTGAENWRIAYPAFLLAMVVIGIASYFVLRWGEARSRAKVPAVGSEEAPPEGAVLETTPTPAGKGATRRKARRR